MGIIERIRGKSEDETEDEFEDTFSYHNPVDRFAYSLFGGFFRGQDDTYASFDRALKQARIQVSYDVYLSRIVLYSLSAAILGILVGVLGTLALEELLLQFGVCVSFPPSIANVLERNALLVRGLIVTFISTTLLFSTVLGSLYYWPYYVASERGRKIDKMLPHATTFMYAMSRGGVNIQDVMKAIAEADDMYGEASKEFAAIVNNVDNVKEDLQTAVREEAAVTPSDEMQEFLEDLLNVIDSGSDMESYFLNKSELYLERLKEKQEQTLDILELMSEAYVTLFVASPIFIIVILMVMGLMGGSNLLYMWVMTYFALPMGAVFFTIIMKLISPSGVAGERKLKRDFLDEFVRGPTNTAELKQDSRYKKYKFYRNVKRGFELVLLPFKRMRRKPLYTLLVTVPITTLYILYVHFSGFLVLTQSTFFNSPVWATLIVVVVPVYMVGFPISLLYELNARREKKILKKLPEVFKSAAEANARGLDVQESFKLVSENVEGELSDELKYSFNQASWTGNVNDALIGMANRMEVPRLSRTVKVITEANQASGDVQAVLEVAAQDVENMYNLDSQRKQNAMTYLVIIILAFFIALGVIAMLDSAFLSTIAEQGSSSGAGSGSGSGLGGGQNFGSLSVEKYRLAFLHTTIVLGFTAGCVGGAMANNSVQSGLKFSLFATLVATLAFAFV